MLFLLPGHTEMPADSVHATIERFIHKRHVWAPSEWATVIRAARINPFPYEVVTLEQKDIHNWSADCEFASGSKNVKGGKVPWKDIRIFAANSGKVRYSTTANPDAVFESVLFRSRGQPRRELKLPRRAYNSLLSISSSKYKDLTELCRKGAVPAAYHQEYYSLRSSASQPDKLDETDEEDGNIEEDK